MREQEQQSESGLKDYWQIIVRRKWIVISFCFICTATVAIANLLMTPLYRGTTTVVVEGEDTDVVAYGKSQTQGVGYDVFENYLNTQMAVIRSRTVAGKVFDEFKLAGIERYKDSDDPLKLFIGDISVENMKGTRIIRVSVDNPSPQMAADLSNRLAEAYAQDNLMRRALTFIRNQRMASLNSEFLRLQAKHDTLSNQYGPKHPDMIALREEIRAMAERMKSERLGDSGQGRALSEDQSLLEDALLKIQESSVLSSSRMSNIVISDRATVPTKKHSPARTLNTLIGFAGGLIAGVFLAFTINYFDDTIKTESDLKRYLSGVFYLGSTLFQHDRKHGGHSKQSNIDHLVAYRSESASAEAYRLIRTRILWSLPKDSPIKDIAVLSSIPGEGKTTIVSNLAIALAQMNFKVLLVDADLRRGRLHDSYGLPNHEGLGHYMTSDMAVEKVIRSTEIPNLSVVTSGTSVIDSSQLFDSPKAQEFIRETRKRFDFILYDTPPMTLISDAAILISRLNGVVLASRSGVTGTRDLPRALAIIRESNTRLIGVILNAADSSNNPVYYKYYHKR